MTDPIRFSRRSVFGLAAAAAAGAALAGCSDDGGGGSGSAKKIRWWHIANTDPMMSKWADMAHQFEAAHPGVKFEITPLENEAFKTKLTTVIQAGDPPDIFHTWGGGVLAQQADAGMVKDLTAEVGGWRDTLIPAALDAYTIDGKTYASAVDTGMVGFWYNKELFDKAKITTMPTTWAEFLDAVSKLKAAKVVPIALAGKEKWPGHYYWAYLAMRVAGLDALRQAAADKNFETPDFVAAGARLAELVALQPFQTGYLAAGYSTADGQAATMGNGKAAMELMGQWAFGANSGSAGDNKDNYVANVGWFPFPKVSGGGGSQDTMMGGGDGFSCSKKAPKECVEFLKYIVSPDVQKAFAGTGSGIPTVKGAEAGLADPVLQTIAKATQSAGGTQLWLDTTFGAKAGTAMNDAIVAIFAGQGTPQGVVDALQKATAR